MKRLAQRAMKLSSRFMKGSLYPISLRSFYFPGPLPAGNQSEPDATGFS